MAHPVYKNMRKVSELSTYDIYIYIRCDYKAIAPTHTAISRSRALSIWILKSEHALSRLCASCLHVQNVSIISHHQTANYQSAQKMFNNFN